MTVVKMPPVNVGPCVTAFTQVSADADICKGDGSGPSQTVRVLGEEVKNVTLQTFYLHEAKSCNLSRKNAKP